MLLSKETTIIINETQSNILGHMNYAASKLWNLCNYERQNYDKLNLDKYPDWYYQKSQHKDNIWYKSLPSQTAQEICKLLDKSWKSFFKLIETGGVSNPRPPRYKQDGMPITYMQNGIKHQKGSNRIRLSLSKELKTFMSGNYGIRENYLIFENSIFENTDIIKQVKLYPPECGVSRCIVIYEVSEPDLKPDNGKALSIDLGIHNLMTCYNHSARESFIIGREYSSIARYFDKEIAHYQSISDSQQSSKGIKYPSKSKRVLKLYEKKRNSIKDYLHKCTKAVVSYCIDNDISTLIIGDINGIRKDNDIGHHNNQKLHSLPYDKIYIMLEYKCKMAGIRFVKISEAYSSQCSPLSPEASKDYANEENRKMRGLYCDEGKVWNADCVGAFNILRLYHQSKNDNIKIKPQGIDNPRLIKVAV